MHILCITRAYPPVIGGMERLSFEFTEALRKRTQTILVANRHGKAVLPWFLPYAALRLRHLAPQVDIIHLGDPLLTCLLPFLPQRPSGRPPAPSPKSPSGPGVTERAWFGSGGAEREGDRRSERGTLGRANGDLETRRRARARQGPPPVAVTIHGLDIRYPNPLYQSMLRRFLPQVDLALCISRFVEAEVRARFPTVRTTVMTPGLSETFAAPGATRADLEQRLGRTLGSGPLLLAVARLVRRKGVAWFVEHVLPTITAATLLVIGDGPERDAVIAAGNRARVSDRVLLLGAQDRETLRHAYSVADLLVMPNIPVSGDAEGFGIVALEATSAGLPVIASRIEGIPDAVVEGETGVLVPPKDATAWAKTIERLLADTAERARIRQSAPRVVRDRFSWDRRADEILRHFVRLTDRES